VAKANRGKKQKLLLGRTCGFIERQMARASMTAATAATTRSSGRHWCRRCGRSAISVPVRRAEYRKLNGIFLSRALGAGNLLILI
jgi:hypothetical protein